MASTMTTRPVGTVTRPEPVLVLFSSIETRGLVSRLIAELSLACSELKRDPRSFVSGLFIPDAAVKNVKRRRLILSGLGVALLTYAVALAIILIIGLRRIVAPTPPASTEHSKVTWVNPKDFTVPYSGDNGTGKGGAQEGIGANGGGGGQEAPKPVSKGPAPLMAPEPQIVRANPSDIKDPSLPVPPTLLAQNMGEPPPPVTLGDPKGKPGDFSAGPGTGGGLGSGKGTGDGPGNGGGLGKGGGGNAGSGPTGNGPNGGGTYDFRLVPKNSGYRPFTWIYRPHPVITPEAIENKVEGKVWLRATFRADGTITDVSVIQPVDYMTESAIDALKHSRFRPAMINGIAITLTNVAVQVEITTGQLHH